MNLPMDHVPAWRSSIARPELMEVPDEVVGPRLLLRRYAPGDGAAMHAAMAEHRDELMRWMAWPAAHEHPAETESYVRRMHHEWALRRAMPMGIWSRNAADPGYLGGTGFHAPDWQVPSAEIGYFLVAPARGHGYATEAVSLLVRFAFEHLRLNRVHASCDASNADSAAVLRRAGLVEEGRRRACARDHHGNLRDTLLFGLALDDFAEWSALRDPLRQERGGGHAGRG